MDELAVGERHPTIKRQFSSCCSATLAAVSKQITKTPVSENEILVWVYRISPIASNLSNWRSHDHLSLSRLLSKTQQHGFISRQGRMNW
jgi:hypothetical protein